MSERDERAARRERAASERERVPAEAALGVAARGASEAARDRAATAALTTPAGEVSAGGAPPHSAFVTPDAPNLLATLGTVQADLAALSVSHQASQADLQRVADNHDTLAQGMGQMRQQVAHLYQSNEELSASVKAVTHSVEQFQRMATNMMSRLDAVIAGADVSPPMHRFAPSRPSPHAFMAPQQPVPLMHVHAQPHAPGPIQGHAHVAPVPANLAQIVAAYGGDDDDGSQHSDVLDPATNAALAAAAHAAQVAVQHEAPPAPPENAPGVAQDVAPGVDQHAAPAAGANAPVAAQQHAALAPPLVAPGMAQDVAPVVAQNVAPVLAQHAAPAGAANVAPAEHQHVAPVANLAPAVVPGAAVAGGDGGGDSPSHSDDSDDDGDNGPGNNGPPHGGGGHVPSRSGGTRTPSRSGGSDHPHPGGGGGGGGPPSSPGGSGGGPPRSEHTRTPSHREGGGTAASRSRAPRNPDAYAPSAARGGGHSATHWRESGAPSAPRGELPRFSREDAEALLDMHGLTLVPDEHGVCVTASERDALVNGLMGPRLIQRSPYQAARDCWTAHFKARPYKEDSEHYVKWRTKVLRQLARCRVQLAFLGVEAQFSEEEVYNGLRALLPSHTLPKLDASTEMAENAEAFFARLDTIYREDRPGLDAAVEVAWHQNTVTYSAQAAKFVGLYYKYKIRAPLTGPAFVANFLRRLRTPMPPAMGTFITRLDELLRRDMLTQSHPQFATNGMRYVYETCELLDREESQVHASQTHTRLLEAAQAAQPPSHLQAAAAASHLLAAQSEARYLPCSASCSAATRGRVRAAFWRQRDAWRRAGSHWRPWRRPSKRPRPQWRPRAPKRRR